MTEGRYAHRFEKPKQRHHALKEYEQDEMGSYARVEWPGQKSIWRFRDGVELSIDFEHWEHKDMEAFKQFIRRKYG